MPLKRCSALDVRESCAADGAPARVARFRLTAHEP